MAKKHTLLFFLAVYLLIFSISKGMCSDFDDKIGPDPSIVQEDSINKKKPNKSYIKQQAHSAANKELREQKKKDDEYSTYKIKGPLGGVQKIKMKNEKDKTKKADTGSQGLGNVTVGPGAKTKDINVFVETKDATVINVNKK
jgi:rRNA pseudouridine-1189 N-methylase Emg1 (Nep1/Mra1 family)